VEEGWRRELVLFALSLKRLFYFGRHPGRFEGGCGVVVVAKLVMAALFQMR
jgi:hypothetical protein